MLRLSSQAPLRYTELCRFFQVAWLPGQVKRWVRGGPKGLLELQGRGLAWLDGVLRAWCEQWKLDVSSDFLEKKLQGTTHSTCYMKIIVYTPYPDGWKPPFVN